MSTLKINIILLATLLASIAFSQDFKIELGQSFYNYKTDSVEMHQDSIVTHSFSKSDLYFRIHADSAWTPVGNHAKNLKPYMSPNKMAFKEFKKYKRRHFTGSTLSLSGGIIFVPLVFLVTPIGAAAITGSTSTAGMIIAKNAEEHLSKSVALLNAGYQNTKMQLTEVMVVH